MRRSKQRKNRMQSGELGVLESHSPFGFGHDGAVWIAYWIDLAEDGRMAVDIDPDRSANISPAAWGRARRAFGLPERILVLDEETAARVRRVVPRRVEVTLAPDHPRLTRMAATFDDLGRDDVDDLDILLDPAARARS